MTFAYVALIAWRRVRQLQRDLRRAQQNGLLPGPPGGQDYETVIELTYRIDLHQGAVFIQPDLQYIIQPGGTSHIENALVLGTQIGINF